MVGYFNFLNGLSFLKLWNNISSSFDFIQIVYCLKFTRNEKFIMAQDPNVNPWNRLCWTAVYIHSIQLLSYVVPPPELDANLCR